MIFSFRPAEGYLVLGGGFNVLVLFFKKEGVVAFPFSLGRSRAKEWGKVNELSMVVSD